MSNLSIERAREILADTVWSHPSDYGGYSPDGAYIFASVNRDSNLLDQSNWDSINKAFEPFDQDFVITWRAGHWAVGWVEYFGIAENAPDEMIIEAAEIVAALEDYPILDESDYSERQYEAVQDYWENESIRYRLEIFKDSGAAEDGESVFSIRRDYCEGRIFDWLFDSEITH